MRNLSSTLDLICLCTVTLTRTSTTTLITEVLRKCFLSHPNWPSEQIPSILSIPNSIIQPMQDQYNHIMFKPQVSLTLPGSQKAGMLLYLSLPAYCQTATFYTSTDITIQQLLCSLQYMSLLPFGMFTHQKP